jgi:hypothetical protein
MAAAVIATRPAKPIAAIRQDSGYAAIDGLLDFD